MARILFIGDTHNGANGNSPRLLRQNVELYKNFIFPIIKEHDIDFCIDLGDFFDDREKIDIKTLKSVREEMLKDLPCPFYFLVGNHNQYYKNNNLLNNLETTIGDIEGVHIVDRFMQVDRVDLFPWVMDKNVEAYKTAISLSENPFAAGHFEFNGFQFDKSRVADVKEKLPASAFKKYKAVFSGHYHVASQKDNIIYVGSPVQLTWIDCDVEKRVIVLDTYTGEWYDIVNPNNLYAQFTVNESGELPSINKEDIYGKRVKIHYPVDLEKEKVNNLHAILKSWEPDQLTFVPYGQKSKVKQKVSISEGLEKTIHEYVWSMPHDGSKIKSLIEKLILSYYNKSQKKE